MEYGIEIIIYLAALLTVPVQSWLVGFVLDVTRLRGKQFHLGARVVKWGNFAALIVAGLAAFLTEAANILATGEALDPQRFGIVLTALGVATWKFYNDQTSQ